MNMEDAESELGIKMAITESGKKSNWQVHFAQVSGIIIIALVGVFLQEVFRFGNGVILWLLFASIFVTGKMLLGGQAMAGNVQSDILLAIHKELKKTNA
ncbi:MAG: hypothetical protein IH886_13350 [Nitrospinae bacterium]|nr:hypothetical protein [Nitrospinota bacterium]